MRKLLIAAAALGLVIAAIPASAATVVNTKHDMSSWYSTTTEVCVFCHTPHQATEANKQDPLWNHSLSQNANYGVYASDTLNAVPANFGGGGASPGTLNVSQLCMSCHDGTVAVGSVMNAPPGGVGSATAAGNVDSAGKITGNPKLGTDLTNDHPVNFDYNATLVTADGGGLNTPASSAWVDAGKKVPLFNASLQCASCHDPHDATNAPFLVMSNGDSALCTTCHIK